MRMPSVIAVIALVAVAAALIDDDDAPDGERPVHCEVIVDAPEDSETAGKMAGRARFNCDAPGAEALEIKMKIERREGEQWHTVSETTHSVSGQDTNAGAFKHQSRLIEVNCGTGSFRTVLDWSRVSKGDTHGDNLVSGVRRDPCG
jgi:hypothetical protein